jgi:hypothetical protein
MAVMSKGFRQWKIDEVQLLPASVQDYVASDDLSHLIVGLVRESLDLSTIVGSYRSVAGQPPFDPRLMTALLLHGYASGLYSSRRIARASVQRADFMMIVAGDAPDFRTISEFRPGTAAGVVFVTLEDEFGIANLVVWPAVFETYRRTVMGARMLAAKGHVQREGIVIHLVVERLWDWSGDLDSIATLDGHFELRNGRGDQVRSSTPDPRDEPRPALTKPVTPQQPYDRGPIHLDRPVIKIASRDFH